MVRVVVSMIGWAVLAAFVIPIVVFFAVLLLAYGLDPRCGTAGDSGGCEMGAVSIALVSLVPGAAIGASIGFVRARRRAAAAVRE